MRKEGRGDIIVFVGVLCGLLLLGWKIWSPRQAATPPATSVVYAGMPSPTGVPDARVMSSKHKFGALTIAPTVTDLEGDAEVMRGFLDVRMWKFATQNRKNSDVTFELQVRETGKQPQTLSGEVSFGPDTPGVSAHGRNFLYVALRPMDASERKLKYMIGTREGSSSGSFENVFKNARTSSSPDSSDRAQPVLKGVLLLWKTEFGDYNSKTGAYPRTRYLVLKVTSKARK